MLSIDLMTGDNTRTVADPDLALVSQTTEYNVTECGAWETGATYNIQIIDTFYAERKLCGIFPICQMLQRAKFSIEDAAHTIESVNQTTQDFTGLTIPTISVGGRASYCRGVDQWHQGVIAVECDRLSSVWDTVSGDEDWGFNGLI